jgi:MoxR-like ATPase
MTWKVYTGGATPHRVEAWPEPPPWRDFRATAHPRPPVFKPPEHLVDAVNTAIYLRRPLLITGPPGAGKSSVAASIAHELALGDVLRWPVTSTSTLEDAVYRYDALGRLHHAQLSRRTRRLPVGTPVDDITRFLRLGPLGTALVAPKGPRVLLVDELDKGDLDLPGNLLNVLEDGHYEILELSRIGGHHDVFGLTADDGPFRLHDGQVTCRHFPLIVMTSNGERTFPAPFLRRCVRVELKLPQREELAEIVAAHFDADTAAAQSRLIREFAARIHHPDRPAQLAIDQLLNAVFLVTHASPPSPGERASVLELVQRELDRS